MFVNRKTAQVMDGLPSSEGTKKMSDEDIKAYANKTVSASQVRLEVYPWVTLKGSKAS